MMLLTLHDHQWRHMQPNWHAICTNVELLQTFSFTGDNMLGTLL